MKGQNLRILIGSPAKCVAFATSCTYHISNSLEDSSTKDTEGSFQKQEVTGCAGDISCDALYSVETDSNGINGQDALDLVLEGQEVDVEFSPTTGTKNRTATGVPYTCKAIVNDININAPNRQNVTYTIQMQMNSKPVKGSAVSSSEVGG
jgi:hypothetical protein